MFELEMMLWNSDFIRCLCLVSNNAIGAWGVEFLLCYIRQLTKYGIDLKMSVSNMFFQLSFPSDYSICLCLLILKNTDQEAWRWGTGTYWIMAILHIFSSVMVYRGDHPESFCVGLNVNVNKKVKRI